MKRIARNRRERHGTQGRAERHRVREEAAAYAAEHELDEGEDADQLAEAVREMMRRGKQANLSFFAFTATPKYKTLKVFDEPGPTGTAPFHLYTMRQAIEEKFILDVLKNYTTYETYFRIVQATEEDVHVERKKAARALARILALHPHNLAQRTEVMVEHFRTHVKHKIGGRAKAMVVTDSRLHAVRYKQAFDKYIAEKGYTDVRTLVAFSGIVEDPDAPGKNWTEVAMNGGIRKRALPEVRSHEYQCCRWRKHQTGFVNRWHTLRGRNCRPYPSGALPEPVAGRGHVHLISCSSRRNLKPSTLP